MYPDLALELALAPARVAGVDEAGRGPLAGPVVAAAVIFAQGAQIPPGIRDSKQLSAARRAQLAERLMHTPGVHWAIGEASVEEIDARNILQASLLAMRRALAALDPAPQMALIDGNRVPTGLACPAQPIIAGDRRCLSIAAASILAKTHRDAAMAILATQYPGYGFERHAGYGTRTHLTALAQLGPCPAHRRSFAPVRACIEAA